jgi:hypothetical protein
MIKSDEWVGIAQDIELLEQALARVKEVMTHLNEEKRRTEGQIHIFDIYSEIENCPASVVSSHRRYELPTELSSAEVFGPIRNFPVVLFRTVLRIHDILLWIRIWGSMPLTNGSGFGS